RLRCMLARRAAAEVAVDDEDRGAAVTLGGKGMRLAFGRTRRDVVLERVPLEALEGDHPQEASRDDAVGVDVVACQRDQASFDAGDSPRPAHAAPPSTDTGASARAEIFLMSTTSPAIAAAATIAGLM